ncbi:phosphotransferase [Actinoplanes sp. CA-252034]|uniref:phosphotransferase n=1 Tax=Actinoplanes sp. CA-252034 TaxID=3239906 RepID=UPI003D957EEB
MSLLGSGREADVYAIDEGRVLRRYRRGDDATAEARLMTYLAGHGYPVPHVHSASGADMILERLDWPTMTDAFTAGDLGVDDGAAILVRLHDSLHRLPSRSGRGSILHRDLHPENVMLTARGPVVIDWHNAAEGRPAVDVCLTAIIMAQVAADSGHPHTAAATAFLTAFLTRAGGDPLDGLGEALEIRRADPALTATEAGGLAATVTPLIHDALS